MQNDSEYLVSAANLHKIFDISGGFLDQLSWKNGRLQREKTLVKAITDVSFAIRPGETLSVVGESGCGKSTLGRTVIGLHQPNSGEVFYKQTRIDTLSPQQMLPFRRRMQMVFQDPYASLNPRKRVIKILEEPLAFHFPRLTAAERRDRLEEVMLQVGGDPQWLNRLPHEFSGGQRQRISIARALVVDPEFIVADEPISALDVSIQAQILNLMLDAQEERGLTYLFIAHDLSVVEHISTRVAVMYLGTMCEVATTAELFSNPKHPYTQALLSAIPRLGHKREGHVRLKGEVPTPINLPPGCVFHRRCRFARDICRQEFPELMAMPDGRHVACHGIREGWV
ncbi:oligopeptide/dipeptide ABC transporter ATP-binding protein [Desulfovermiculus halophilus]|uniref:ABC transporter ATP-binding protein n=1 Tax=Desulfovermiculus halophilus TaxID=339722 RepID=UPI0004825522